MRKWVTVCCALLAMAVVLPGCSSHKSTKSAKLDPFAGVGSPYFKGRGPVPMGGGRYQVGKPYQVAGRWFTPHEQPNYDKVGLSSWYGEAFHRRKTSNGEWFDMARLTAAHATLPLPSYAKVTNLENGTSVVVRINDRGPFVDTRVLDVSKRVAEVLGYKQQGTAQVRVQYIGPAPLNDDGRHLAAMNRELENGTPLRRMIAAADSTSPSSAPVQVAEREVPVQQASYQPPPVSSDGVSYFIQVGSFSDPGNADQIRDNLSGLGPVQVSAIMENSGREIYRVRIGPFADMPSAEGALDQVLGAGLTDAHLVSARLQQASLQ
jgi:rare lipoprotein A